MCCELHVCRVYYNTGTVYSMCMLWVGQFPLVQGTNNVLSVPPLIGLYTRTMQCIKGANLNEFMLESTCVCVHACVGLYARISVCLHVCMCAYICVCACVRISVCLHVCMCSHVCEDTLSVN